MTANAASPDSKLDPRDRNRGLEMTIVGAVEGIVTYFIGIGIGRITGVGI